jgi:hypothetical protein
MVCPVVKNNCIRLAQELSTLSGLEVGRRLTLIKFIYGNGTLRAVESLSGKSLNFIKKLQNTEICQ